MPTTWRQFFLARRRRKKFARRRREIFCDVSLKTRFQAKGQTQRGRPRAASLTPLCAVGAASCCGDGRRAADRRAVSRRGSKRSIGWGLSSTRAIKGFTHPHGAACHPHSSHPRPTGARKTRLAEAARNFEVLNCHRSAAAAAAMFSATSQPSNCKRGRQQRTQCQQVAHSKNTGQRGTPGLCTATAGWCS